MCGRYALATATEELVEIFEVSQVAFDSWPARYNLAPTQEAPVLIAAASGERRLGLMRWGLVPRWATDPAVGNRMINARSETAATKPAFREAFRHRRCLVPADGFYEWRRWSGGGAGPRKVPYWIHRPDRRPLAIAGLWERWSPTQAGEGAPLLTFTLLTTAANRWMRPLHDRMPAILADEGARSKWLDPASDPTRLGTLLQPAADDLLEAWQVSTRVNRPANDGPDLIRPVEAGDVRAPA